MKESRRQTKKYIRALSKNEKKHPLRNLLRIIKYGILGFGRNVWLSIASTIVMTITLIVLFITAITGVVLSETSESIKSKIDITIYLKPGTDTKTLSSLEEILATDSNIQPETIEKKTSKEELDLFKEENSDNPELIETINDPEMYEIMLGTMQSTIRFKVKDIENLDSIKSLVEISPLFIENIDENEEPTYEMNQAEIKTINSWSNIAKKGGILLSAVFLTLSVLIIFNTIRMAIFARKEEIYMMKLVGADPSFIKGPFLIEAEISGIISGVLASILGVFLYNLLSPRLISYGISTTFLDSIFNTEKIIIFYAAMILLGILIGAFSARLATKKYLRKL